MAQCVCTDQPTATPGECDHTYPPANADGTCPSCGKVRAATPDEPARLLGESDYEALDQLYDPEPATPDADVQAVKGYALLLCERLHPTRWREFEGRERYPALRHPCMDCNHLAAALVASPHYQQVLAAVWDESAKFIVTQALSTSPEWAVERADRFNRFNPYRAAAQETNTTMKEKEDGRTT